MNSLFFILCRFLRVKFFKHKTKGYFLDKELSCPCCGEGSLRSTFRDMLDDARYIAGIPFIVTSAYRCVLHNKKVGGKESSSHLLGEAVDLSVENSRVRLRIVISLLLVGINRIGVGSNFIHADDDWSKDQEVMWVY